MILMREVYLDNNATTPVDPCVVEAMTPFFTQHFGNASSVHSAGQAARKAVEKARSRVASLLNCEPAEVVFTSGGTEADNAALLGVAAALSQPGHLITSRIEHPAILKMSELLHGRGVGVSYVEPDRDGIVSVESVRAAIRDETQLISIMFVNNETGSVQPVGEMAELARRHGILFHTDAVQASGKIPLDVRSLGVDLLSISAHKFHGPKGVGALFVRTGTPFQPMLVGGSHEKKRRAGTENVPGIVGFGEACRLARQHLSDFMTRTAGLRDHLESTLLATVPDTSVNGSRAHRAPHVTNLSFADADGEAILVALDFEGVSVSTGAACASGSISASHVLKAMKLPEERLRGAIRFSLGRMTTPEDIDYVFGVLPAVIGRIRETSSVRS